MTRCSTVLIDAHQHSTVRCSASSAGPEVHGHDKLASISRLTASAAYRLALSCSPCWAVACRLSKLDQERVFPNSIAFDSPADQEAFVREWAQKRTGLACDFKVRFYPGRYAPEKGESPWCHHLAVILSPAPCQCVDRFETLAVSSVSRNRC
jgi:hypothetical protein